MEHSGAPTGMRVFSGRTPTALSLKYANLIFFDFMQFVLPSKQNHDCLLLCFKKIRLPQYIPVPDDSRQIRTKLFKGKKTFYQTNPKEYPPPTKTAIFMTLTPELFRFGLRSA